MALGNSVSGAPITMYVLGAGPEAVLIFSAIHGNQPARAFVDRKLLEHIEASPSVYDDRRVALITVVNPDGLVAGARTNANCVDCNRNFLRPTGRPGSGAAPTGVRGRAASRRLWPGQKNGRGCWRQSAAARSSRWRGRSEPGRRSPGARGSRRAFLALARVVYALMRHGTAYVDTGQEAYEQQFRQRRLRALERTARKMGTTLVGSAL